MRWVPANSLRRAARRTMACQDLSDFQILGSCSLPISQTLGCVMRWNTNKPPSLSLLAKSYGVRMFRLTSLPSNSVAARSTSMVSLKVKVPLTNIRSMSLLAVSSFSQWSHKQKPPLSAWPRAPAPVARARPIPRFCASSHTTSDKSDRRGWLGNASDCPRA